MSKLSNFFDKNGKLIKKEQLFEQCFDEEYGYLKDEFKEELKSLIATVPANSDLAGLYWMGRADTHGNYETVGLFSRIV